MQRETVPEDAHDPLRCAWAEHLGIEATDERVYGWPDDFDTFVAGWNAGKHGATSLFERTTAHMIYEATTHQIAGLELERQAHLQQIAGLVQERDALRADATHAWRCAADASEENNALRAANAALAADLDRVAARAYAWRNAYAGGGVPPRTDSELPFVHSPDYPPEDAPDVDA